MAAVRDPAAVLPTIARALHIATGDDGPALAGLAAALRHARLLLVLDNLEQVLGAAPELVDLLAAAPHVTMLITSRSPLRVRGEHAFPVSPLGLPAPEDDAPDRLATAGAVALFVERAQAALPTFALTRATAPIVAEICRRLDGLPLAIELAAARVAHLALPELLARLDRRLPLLTGGPRDLPARLRTMRDAIAWSYDQLPPEEQSLFRQLSVFAGGFTLAALEGMRDEGRGMRGEDGDGAPSSSLIPHPSSLDGLASLVDKSLVRSEPDAPGGPRYGLLETVREYAAERLAASGEERVVRERHARWFLAFAERHEVVYNDPRREPHLALLDAEWPNLQTAFAWLETAGDPTAALGLAVALYQFSSLTGHTVTLAAWLARALALADTVPALLRGKALTALAYVTRFHGEAALAEADASAAEGLALQRGLGVPVDLQIALIVAGCVALQRRDYARAEAYLEQALAVVPTIADPERAAAAATALRNLGEVAHGQGRLDLAISRQERALALYRQEGNAWGEMAVLQHLGDLARDRGEHDHAVAWYRQCLGFAWPRGDAMVIAAALGGIMCAATAWGQHVLALQIGAAARRMLERAGIIDLMPTDDDAFERVDRELRAVLGEDLFAAERLIGRAMTTEEIQQAGAAVEPPSAGAATPPDDRVGLSSREREVLHLLAAGRTNRTIGEALYISERTVDSHVARIYAKFGVRTRPEAIEAARAAGLIVPPSAPVSPPSPPKP